MITYNQTEGSIKQQKVHQVTYKRSEYALLHQLERRADLTNTPIIQVIKNYCKEGIKNDPFLKMYSL